MRHSHRKRGLRSRGWKAPRARRRPEAPADPLGRSTPRGTIVEFTRAVDRGDFTPAALYLQLDQ